MDYVGFIDATMKTYRDNLKAAKAINPVRINVQPVTTTHHPRMRCKSGSRWRRRPKSWGFNVDLEVHRDTCTETPEKTYEIADLYKKGGGETHSILLGLFPFAVVKHLNPPYAPRLLERPELVQTPGNSISARSMGTIAKFRPPTEKATPVPKSNLTSSSSINSSPAGSRVRGAVKFSMSAPNMA